MDFILGQPLEMEETLTCEYKEVKGGNPVKQIVQTIDVYAVAFLNAKGGSAYWGVRDEDRVVVGLQLPSAKRDELRQVVGQKIAAIAPPIPPGAIDMPIHQVQQVGISDSYSPDLYVVEVAVKTPEHPDLFFTGAGEAYRKTMGGKKKLSGSELVASLFAQLSRKQQSAPIDAAAIWGPLADFMTSVTRRAEVVAPLLRGSRIMWVDDIPGHTIYERSAFEAMGVGIDVAISSIEASLMLEDHVPDLIISDIRRGPRPEAGLEFLADLRSKGVSTPLIFYIGDLDNSRPKPRGSFGITNVPSELFHLTFDVLERIRSVSG